MVYKPRSERKRARGGKATDTQPYEPEHGHLYNAEGSPESHSIDAKSDGFKRGGAQKKKRKEGGKVEGEKARHHLGRRARGGHIAHREEGGMTPHPRGHETHGEHTELMHRRGEEEKTEHERHEERPERARGGRTERAPFSSAQKTEPPGNERDGPGEQAPMIP